MSDIPGDELSLPPADGPDVDEVFALLDQMEAEANVAESPPDSPPSDRRQHPRTPPKGHVPATLLRDGAAPARLAVRDLSRSGVGLFSPSPISEGIICTVTLESTAGPNRPPLRASCRIATCRLSADGRYVLGLQFLSIVR